MNARSNRCRANTKTGNQCKAATLPKSDFCFFHDPDKAGKRREAQSTGGRQGKIQALPSYAPAVDVASCQDVVRLISETINQVRTGQVDPRIANAVGYLANVIIKALEQGELEDRLTDLETAIKSRRNEQTDFTMTGTEV